MTVDELHDVITERLDDIKALVERQNGRVSQAERDIVDLRIRDAYWAGGAAVAVLLIKLLWG